MPVMLWCSATQYRVYPSRSACRARSRLLWSASRGVEPARIGTRSRTDRGTIQASPVQVAGRAAAKPPSPAPARLLLMIVTGNGVREFLIEAAIGHVGGQF